MGQPGTILESVARRLERGEIELPVFDDVAMRLWRLSRDPEADGETLANALAQDPGLVAEVLRIASSSFFGGLPEGATLLQAIVRLGSRQLGAISLSAGYRRLYEDLREPFRSRMNELWRASVTRADIAFLTARRAGLTAHREEAYVAALLLELGRISLLCVLEDVSRDTAIEPDAEEVERFLDELRLRYGEELIERWGLPESVAELVRTQDVWVAEEASPLACIVSLSRESTRVVSEKPTSDVETLIGARWEFSRLGLDEEDAEVLAEASVEAWRRHGRSVGGAVY